MKFCVSVRLRGLAREAEHLDPGSALASSAAHASARVGPAQTMTVGPGAGERRAERARRRVAPAPRRAAAPRRRGSGSCRRSPATRLGEQLRRAGRERGAEQRRAARRCGGIARARSSAAAPRATGRCAGAPRGRARSATAGGASAIRAMRPSQVRQTPPASAAARLSAWPSSGSPSASSSSGSASRRGRDRARDEPEGDGRGARAEPALARDAVDRAERAARGVGEQRERAHREVLRVGLAASRDLQLVPEVERDGGAVEARPEVRGRRRGARREIVTRRRRRRSGSFSPWPVTTQTTRLPGSSPASASPATPAALDGSAKSALLAREQPPGGEDLVVGRR